MTHSHEYWLTTGPDDPHTITVDTPSGDGTSGKHLAVHLVAEYAGKPDAHLSLGAELARHMGGLLIQAAETLDARRADKETFNTIVSGTHATAEEDDV
ncbi:hypothetical protein [Streptomyces sp. AK02-04a]|uniref:hypothetical protein n=1 Tax=Streptomyces sp. AK02-04a TaxID=3028649 RepID=UPI0029A6BB71|nr:hypothetical protein [Streptomyces sp. AK02-04a]MDX3763798.1 hypothetical protein [Streptomyces sp. AK02-04a]